MSSSSSFDRSVDAFLEGTGDAGPAHLTLRIASGAGALGAGLASMTSSLLADEGSGPTAPYHEGRAHELGELRSRFAALAELESELDRKLAAAEGERRAGLLLERTEAALELGEAAVACQRLLVASANPPSPAQRVAGELLGAAARSGAQLALARAAEIEGENARRLCLDTAHQIVHQSQALAFTD